MQWKLVLRFSRSKRQLSRRSYHRHRPRKPTPTIAQYAVTAEFKANIGGRDSLQPLEEPGRRRLCPEGPEVPINLSLGLWHGFGHALGLVLRQVVLGQFVRLEESYQQPPQ
ncbi:MAG TPA: hypothetical protein VFE31_00585 [Opitutaceae bacterium]|jgi:hypothetical protein|nr:hypothetical protein [Opitutaceae bacterium]